MDIKTMAQEALLREDCNKSSVIQAISRQSWRILGVPEFKRSSRWYP
jgi:hypothetical protein